LYISKKIAISTFSALTILCESTTPGEASRASSNALRTRTARARAERL